MFDKCINSKKQGDFGLGKTIGWFCEQGYTVSIPLTDSQDYDLVVEIEGNLNRVQVKTTSYIRKGVYCVGLSVKGGNRSYNTIKNFDNTKIDFVFIITSKNDMYLIPSKVLNVTSSINLGKKYDMYKVK